MRLMAAFIAILVRKAGLEPARPYGHMALNHACLPIPALPHVAVNTGIIARCQHMRSRVIDLLADNSAMK